jgi:hypothetical protein
MKECSIFPTPPHLIPPARDIGLPHATLLRYRKIAGIRNPKIPASPSVPRISARFAPGMRGGAVVSLRPHDASAAPVPLATAGGSSSAPPRGPVARRKSQRPQAGAAARAPLHDGAADPAECRASADSCSDARILLAPGAMELERRRRRDQRATGATAARYQVTARQPRSGGLVQADLVAEVFELGGEVRDFATAVGLG